MLLILAFAFGFVLFATAAGYKKYKNIGLPSYAWLELLVTSFVTASSVVLLGVNSLWWGIFSDIWTGPLQTLRWPLVLGGLVIIFVGLHRYHDIVIH